MIRYKLLRIDGSGVKYEAFYAADETSSLTFMNDINPRFLVNSLLVTYYVSIWERYLADSYIAIVRHDGLENAENVKLSLERDDLETITAGNTTVEETLTRNLSFQRPSIVAGNFRAIDRDLDIAGSLKRPYHRRKKSLFESIDNYIDLRNEIAHMGHSDTCPTDGSTDAIASDFVAAVERVYEEFASHYRFTPLRGY